MNDVLGTVLQQGRHAVAKTIARPAIDRRKFINRLAGLAIGDLEPRWAGSRERRSPAPRGMA